MNEVLTIIAVSSGAFIGTNLDNLILLVAFYSRYQKQSGMVASGYICGMLLIAAIAFAIGKGGELIPLAYLGLLGLIPMGFGVFALVQLFKKVQTDKSADTVLQVGHKAVFLSVLLTQLSNSSDSIITFSVFLADSQDHADIIIALAFLGMTCTFAWLAYFSLRHRKLNDVLSRYGPYLTPFILVLVGFYILSNTASDLLPG